MEGSSVIGAMHQQLDRAYEQYGAVDHVAIGTRIYNLLKEDMIKNMRYDQPRFWPGQGGFNQLVFCDVPVYVCHSQPPNMLRWFGKGGILECRWQQRMIFNVEVYIEAALP